MSRTDILENKLTDTIYIYIISFIDSIIQHRHNTRGLYIYHITPTNNHIHKEQIIKKSLRGPCLLSLTNFDNFKKKKEEKKIDTRDRNE